MIFSVLFLEHFFDLSHYVVQRVNVGSFGGEGFTRLVFKAKTPLSHSMEEEER